MRLNDGGKVREKKRKRKRRKTGRFGPLSGWDARPH